MDGMCLKLFSNEVLSVYRSEVSRLAEENVVLRQKLVSLNEETQEELL